MYKRNVNVKESLNFKRLRMIKPERTKVLFSTWNFEDSKQELRIKIDLWIVSSGE